MDENIFLQHLQQKHKIARNKFNKIWKVPYEEIIKNTIEGTKLCRMGTHNLLFQRGVNIIKDFSFP